MASRGDINVNLVQPPLCERWLQIDVDETLEKTGKYTKLKSKDYFDAGNYPVIDQGDKFVSGFIDDESLLYQGALPIIIFGDHTRNIKYVDFKFAAGADGTKILRPNKCFDPKFYFYYFKSLSIPDLGYSRHYALLKLIKFPLPPLAEQQRIVAKLDALFGQLETIKKSLENVPVLLKNFRQQVLTQAVTGKLTEEWRKGKDLEDPKKVINEIANRRRIKSSPSLLKKLEDIYNDMSLTVDYDSPKEWLDVNLDKVCEKFSYGTSTKSDETGDFVVLRMGNLQNGKINWNDLKYTSDLSEFEKYKLDKGDVLFNRTNSPDLVGKTSIFEGEYSSIYAGYLIKIWNYNELNSYYLNYVMNSDFVRKWCWEVKSDGVSQSNINAQKLSKLTIPFPSTKEQQEIVRRVESLFAKADAIEAQYNTLKEKIDKLPQAILHKAFKGELTQQLDTDGDAQDLLKAIEQLKNTNTKTKKSKL